MPENEGEEMEKRFEFVDHTADSGIVAYGSSLKQMLENAAYGMFNIIADTEKVKPKRSVSIEVEADNHETLLVRMLRELLYLHDAHGLIFKELRVEGLSEEGKGNERRLKLCAIAFGEPTSETEAELYGSIKAVTYHSLKVERRGDGWVGQVIFDV